MALPATILRPVNTISLCAGSGGLDLAVQLAVPAARSVCYVEREASAAASLVASMESGRLHLAPVWSDLASFDAKPWRGIVDIVTSGDPCQPNSVAGKHGGSDDERFLADQVLRIVAECRPFRLFRENVTGNADGQLAAFVPELERMGYRVAAGICSAGETGNSHRRERLFIMADRIGCEQAGRQSIASEAQGGRAYGKSGGCGEALANADGREHGPRGREPVGKQRFQPRRDSVDGELVYAVGGGLRRESDDCNGAKFTDQAKSLFHIIPGPSDLRWRELLAERPELAPALTKPEAESLVCRGFDAVANRIERLRHCGNGVDPVAGAMAFLYLDALHRSGIDGAGCGPDGRIAGDDWRIAPRRAATRIV